MKATGLILKLNELQNAGPADGEIGKSDHFIYKDESFGTILFVVIDEEVFILYFLIFVLGFVN